MADTDTVDEKAEAARILKAVASPEEKAPEETQLPPASPGEEDIEKPIPHKEWVWEAEYEVELKNKIEKKLFKRTYIQKPLSYHAFAEFTGLLGRTLAEAMRGPEGLSLEKIGPDQPAIPLEFSDGRLSLADTGSALEGVDTIIQGVAKLVTYVPDFLAEAQCIWLRVPRNERALLIDIWARPVDEGGMSMNQGEEMMNIFLEQNYDELETFLARFVRLRETAQKMRMRKHKGSQEG